jgi:CubicO group peptidase (beta-lactamase class C family)
MTNTPAGFSDEKLGRVPRYLEAQIDAGLLPGALIMIWRRGRLVVTARGSMDLARATPMRPDAIFRLYSMTKPITIVALLMLMEEGKIALDDPVAKFIPGFAHLKLQNGAAPNRAMTVLDLLRHTSGLTYGFHNRTAIDAAYRAQRVAEFDTQGGLAAMVGQLEKLPLEYSPGEAWIYSVATDVAGYLVELVSGRPFADFVREQILAPLKMIDTDFQLAAEKRERLAACYTLKDGKLDLFDDPANSAWLSPPKLQSGGGGLAGPARDYLRFCLMLLNKGEFEGARLLSPKTVQLMTANHLPGGKEITDLSPPGSAFTETGYHGIGFGLGVAVTLDPAKMGIPGTKGEFTWGGMASTSFFVDPSEQLAVVFMTQVILDTPRRVRLRRDLRTLIYGAMTESYA